MTSQADKVVAALKAARAALNWSQEDLARRSGVALVTIARTEAGLVSPRLSTITRLKQALEQVGVRIIDESPQGGFTVVVECHALRQDDQAPLRPRTGVGRSKAKRRPKTLENQGDGAAETERTQATREGEE